MSLLPRNVPCGIWIVCCMGWSYGLLWAGQSPRQEKAEFFRLIDFDNASLLSHNSGLAAVRTQVTNAAAVVSDEDALSAYAAATINLLNSLPAHGYSCGPSRVLADSDTFVTNFFSWLDLDHPGLESVKASVQATNWSAALEAWRDYTVGKFRRADGLLLYQHSYKSSAAQQNIASLLMGQKTYDQYYDDATNLYGGIAFFEIYGMSGAPGTIGAISWTNQPPTPDTSLDTKYSYDQFFIASPLVYRFWRGDMLASGADVTLTSVGTAVNLRFTSPHGLSSGDFVTVYGASPDAYNGLFRATVTDPSNVTYTALSVPDVSPAGGSGRTVARARQPEPVAKWFEILADYATRQKNMVSALQLVENTTLRTVYRTVYSDCDWSVQAGAVLGQGDRMRELTAAIGLFCKLLPEEVPTQPDWNTAVQAPNDAPPTPDALQRIPAEALARVALSLMADSTEAAMLAYLRVGMLPNQRLNGLTSLFLVSNYFDEFKAAPELSRQTDAALGNFAATMFYADGPMLERSPNYNAGDADKIRMLLQLAGTNASPGILELSDRLAAYERATAFMQMPLGGLPRMASYGGMNPPPLWQDGSVLAGWRTSFRNSVSATSESVAADLYLGMLDSGLPVPSGTSAAFPYAGYYLLRNGWNSRAHCLYFANTPAGNGHAQMDNNGIQVCAFGRTLLSVAGPPPYDSTFVDPSQSADFTGFASYQGEGSSFKVNTVTVDGRSQNEGGVRNPTVTTNTVEGRWLTSVAFDYVEGTYKSGYGKSSTGYWGTSIYDAFTNSTSVVSSVAHTRSVAFLRHPGLWIVTDILAPVDTISHEYRQIWNFPAYSSTTGPTYGFTTDEVEADTAAQRIATTDADGPNVRLFHLGPTPVTYETYAACRAPYLGWYGLGIGGLRLPAANVHACWQGVGTQLLVTVIAPSDTGAGNPVCAIRTNAASATAIDLDIDLENGHTLRVVQGLQPQSLVVGSQSLSALTLVADISPDGVQTGLVLSAAGLSRTNFSFSAAPDAFTPLSDITVPNVFSWTTNGEWLLPSTAAPQNTSPQIPPVPDQRIAAGSAEVPIPFFVFDNETRASNLCVTAHSLNQSILPDANITLSGTGTNRTITVTPTPEAYGTTQIELILTDPEGLSGTARVTLNVFATLYWDTSTAAGLQAESGLWNGSEANWSFDPSGSAPLSAWADSGNTAIFAGTNANFTVSVTGTQTVNDLRFTAPGCTITGGTLSHPYGTMAIRADADAVINTPIRAVTNVVKTGAACVTLGARGTWAGALSVEAGALRLSVDNALPPSGDLTLGSGATAGALVLDNADQTVRGLFIASTTNAVTNRIEIAAGRTLAVTGPLLTGGAASNITTFAEVIGANATLAVTNDSGLVQIGLGASPVNGNRATLNLAGLGMLIADLGSNGVLRVGDNSGLSGGGQASLLLAVTNVLTAGTLAVGDGGRGVQNILKLGTGATSIRADTVNLGTGGRDSASVSFAAATGTLSLRGSDGAGRAVLCMGTSGSTSGSPANNLADLRGHACDLLLSTLRMGEQMRSGTGTHTLYFDSGVLDAAGLILAQTKASGASTSSVNLGGGETRVGSDGILLASNAVGNLTLTGGSLTTDGDIVRAAGGSGTALLTINGAGATLDLRGHVIGSEAAPVTTVFSAGTLRNLGELNGGADLVKVSAGMLVLDGTNTYGGTTVVSNGLLKLDSPDALPADGSIDVAGGTVDLGRIAPSAGVVTARSGWIVNGALRCVRFVKRESGTLRLGASLASSEPLVVEEGTLTLRGIEPGLDEGALAGAFNTTSQNPYASAQLTTRYANTTSGWPSNTTYVYSGYLWSCAATNVAWTFAENFDDNVYLKVDGTVMMTNGVNWSTPTRSTITLSPGAHPFEARFGQGTGGAGPVDSQWWVTGKKLGFGYDPWGRNETNVANYAALADPGDGTLLTRSPVGEGALTSNLLDSASLINLYAGARLDLGGLSQTLSGLCGGGTVSNGTLAVTGLTAPGGTNAVGALSIVANVTLSGTLLVDVAEDGGCDLLSVSGDLALSGLTLSVANPKALDRQKTYTLATVTGRRTGRIATALPDFRWRILYEPDGTVRLVFACASVILIQ